jgi:enoyl-CoA hydratase/carnithine racemase
LAAVVEIEKAGHVATVTLNRPRVVNAFDRGVIGRLTAVAEELGADPAVRAIVITGAGGNFSSGADIAELRSLRSVLEARELTQEAHHMMDAIEACPKPVIAAVLGYAIGGGQELCLACDLRVAGESATFGQVEVNIGSIPSWGGTQRLARAVGVAYAKDLIYTGRLLTAREAFERGLVSRLVQDDQVMEEARRLAESIAERAPLAVAACKSSVSRAFDNDLAANLAHDVDLFSTLYSSEDLHEGLQAFLEKRAPRFKGL